MKLGGPVTWLSAEELNEELRRIILNLGHLHHLSYRRAALNKLYVAYRMAQKLRKIVNYLEGYKDRLNFGADAEEMLNEVYDIIGRE